MGRVDQMTVAKTTNEFRPVSYVFAAPYFFKLLEMILKGRIEQDIEEGYTKRINLEQYGFEKHLGTEPQILRLIFIVARMQFSKRIIRLRKLILTS